MTQLWLIEGLRLKDEGMQRVASHNEEWLAAARAEARRVAGILGKVSAVELRAWCDERNYHPFSPNAWGAIFRGRQWQHIGWRKAEHARGHARDMKVWRYVSTRVWDER